MVDVVGQLKDTLTNLLVSGVDIVEQGEIVKRENKNSDIEGYDAVVLPLTLEALYEDEKNEHAGWEVRERHGFNLDIDFPAVRVAILGNFNAGKTLVAHRLSNNPDLISGHRRSTHQLCLHEPERPGKRVLQGRLKRQPQKRRTTVRGQFSVRTHCGRCRE